MSIPLNFDPERREWRREFEWHLDIVPALMDTLVSLTLPTIPVSRGGSRFDKLQITGGGYIDNVPLDRFDVTADGAIVAAGAEADARELWSWLVEYTGAVAEWLGESCPTLEPAPNADPLLARSIALTTVGWLIDRADLIEPISELESHRVEMFTLIRRLRGLYGVHRHPRRVRARCGTCGARAVVVDWVDAVNGSPKPEQVGKCRMCGQVYRTEGDE